MSGSESLRPTGSLPRFFCGECGGLWCVWWGGDAPYIYGFIDQATAERLTAQLNERLDALTANVPVTRGGTPSRPAAGSTTDGGGQ